MYIYIHTYIYIYPLSSLELHFQVVSSFSGAARPVLVFSCSLWGRRSEEWAKFPPECLRKRHGVIDPRCEILIGTHVKELFSWGKSSKSSINGGFFNRCFGCFSDFIPGGGWFRSFARHLMQQHLKTQLESQIGARRRKCTRNCGSITLQRGGGIFVP